MQLHPQINQQKNLRRAPANTGMQMPSYGKLPPQAKELEEAILGAIMLDKQAINIAAEILQPQCFYTDAHQRIFTACINMGQRGAVIDILTLVQELKTTGELDMAGGPYAITRLTNNVVSAANMEAHARIVLQKFIQRELIRTGGEMLHDAYEETTDVFDLLDAAETKLFSITNHYLKNDFYHNGTLIAKVVNRVDALRNKPQGITGVSSGFNCIDKITYGWQATDLIVVAARPGVGKTALALNFARHAALHAVSPVAVGFFSLEMSAVQLEQRLLSAESDIPLEHINRGKMDDQAYNQFHNKGVRRLESAPIFIDDAAAINIFKFRAKARRMVSKHGVALIIVDYLQLMSGSNEKNINREQEISTISRNLKALAKELNIAIIALSQLSRAVEARTGANKMPQLSDLRESGAIEQDADMVLFIYRPEYHGNTTNEHGQTTRGETHIKFAKHRNGAVGDIVTLQAQLHVQKFIEDENINYRPLAPQRRIIDYTLPPPQYDEPPF